MKNLGVDGNELVECYRRVLEDGVDVMPYIVGVLYMAWKMPKRFEKNVDHIICANIKEKKGNGKSKPIYDIKIKGYNDDSNCLDYDLQVTTLETFRRSKKVPNPTEFNGRYLMRLLNMNDFENLPKVLDNFVA